jgi:hypothetical protein
MPEKNETKATKQDTFIKLSDLTAQDVQELPVVDVRFEKKVFNSGSTNVSMKAVFNDLFDLELSSMDSRHKIDEDTWKNIILKTDPKAFMDSRGRIVNQVNLPAYYRFVKGKNANDQEYYSVELIFKQYVYKTIFIDRGHAMENVDILEKEGLLKPNWHFNPGRIAVDHNIDFSAE